MSHINKVIEESKYHEIERVLTDFKNSATYSDSIEKIEKILRTSFSNILDAVEKEVEGSKKVIGDGTYCKTCLQHIAAGECNCAGYNIALTDIQSIIKSAKE